MSFDEYVVACYRIPYVKDAVITEFGKPMNCYGFVYWYYKLCRGIELERNDVVSFDSIKCIEYNKVEVPEDGDVVHLRTTSGMYAYHVGLFYKGIVYHMTCEGLASKPYARMVNWIKGVYRVKC